MGWISPMLYSLSIALDWFSIWVFAVTCRYLRFCETSCFVALFGWEDEFDDPERSRYSELIEESQAC